MAGLLIVNPHGGDGAGADELIAAAGSLGIATHVLGPDDDLPGLARSADADAIGIAGGDGSLAAVADVCIERGLPFVCVPFGTRNHFARDLGLDRHDPIGALAAFTDGVERRVDVGRANDRPWMERNDSTSCTSPVAELGLMTCQSPRRACLRRIGSKW